MNRRILARHGCATVALGPTALALSAGAAFAATAGDPARRGSRPTASS